LLLKHLGGISFHFFGVNKKNDSSLSRFFWFFGSIPFNTEENGLRLSSIDDAEVVIRSDRFFSPIVKFEGTPISLFS